jgi:hypothetical protein
MKLWKYGFRIWIAVASVLGFLGGWSFLAHAEKPAPLTSNSNNQDNPPVLVDPTPLPTLAPLPSFDNSPSINLQPIPMQQQPSFQRMAPRMRSGGS